MELFKIIYDIVLIFLLVVVGLLIVSIFPITGNIKFKVVQSGSMSPAIKMGSIVMIRPEKSYKIGDIITFGKETKFQAPITHRIHDITVIGGKPYYITKGDANNAPDINKVGQKEVIGKVLLDIPYLGYAVDFAKKPIGFALFVIIPAAIIIYDEIKKIMQELKKPKVS